MECCFLSFVKASLHKWSESNSSLGTTTGFDESTERALASRVLIRSCPLVRRIYWLLSFLHPCVFCDDKPGCQKELHRNLEAF